MPGALSAMRYLYAITAGIVITFTVATIGTALITGCVQEIVASVTPAAVSDRDYDRILDGAIAVCVVLPGLITAMLMMRVTQPHDKRHHCQQCGYDLTGNESGVCSECGNNYEGKTVS